MHQSLELLTLFIKKIILEFGENTPEPLAVLWQNLLFVGGTRNFFRPWGANICLLGNFSLTSPAILYIHQYTYSMCLVNIRLSENKYI